MTTSAGTFSARPAARSVDRRILPALLGAHRWWVEALVAVGFYLSYSATRGLAPAREALAMANGRALARLEQVPHLAVADWLAQTLNARHLLAVLAGYYYGIAHLLVTVGVLIWLYARHRNAYPRLRTTLLVTSLAALVTFWLVPVAPPRLAVPNAVDTLVSLDILGASQPHSMFNLANPYAAMPSLHVAWAVWCALALAVTSRRQAIRLLAWLYPLLTALVVMGTNNHYLLDVVAGIVLLLAVHQATSGRQRHQSIQ